ncbi:Conserved_hypothetical protein [Hexamita inflata]|uniref:Uncharacterized protein n=2 Tax=Hexamita inflata TaxID=28002 RepID=A0AA86UYN8_9EUKA|nr:Conserved hypothetical protein [Hexamita inflata]
MTDQIISIFYAPSHSSPFQFLTFKLKDDIDDVVLFNSVIKDLNLDEMHQFYTIEQNISSETIQFSFTIGQVLTVLPANAFSPGQLITKTDQLVKYLNTCGGLVIIPQVIQNLADSPLAEQQQKALHSFSNIQINQKIQQCLSCPNIDETMRNIYQFPLKNEDKFKFNQHYASHFFKIFAAVHNAVQTAQDQNYQQFVTESSGNLFLRCTNITQQINSCLNKERDSDMEWLLQNVQLLAHCQIQQDLNQPKAPQNFLPFFDNLFDPNATTEQAESHILGVPRLMHQVQNSASRIGQHLRVRQKTYGDLDFKRCNAPLWLYLVRDNQLNYAVIVGVSQQDPFASDKLSKCRTTRLSYPAQFIAKAAFGEVPDIDGPFKAIDVLSVEFVAKYLEQFNGQCLGLNFFRYAIEWSISNFDQTYIKKVLLNEFEVKLGKALKICGKTSDLTDLVAEKMGGQTVLNNLSPQEILLFNSILDDMGRKQLVQGLKKYQMVNRKWFDKIVSGVINLISKEIISQLPQTSNKFTHDYQLYKISLQELAINILNIINPIEFSEPLLILLQHSLLYSANNISLYKQSNIRLESQVKAIMHNINVSQFSKDVNVNQTFVSNSIIIMQQIKEILVCRKDLLHKLDNLELYDNTIQALFPRIGFSQHIFGQLSQQSPDWYVIREICRDKKQIVQPLQIALENAGVLPTFDQIQKFGQGHTQINTSLLTFNFDQQFSTLEDFSMGQDSPIQGVLLQEKDLLVNEFDDLLEESIQQPNSKLEYWYELVAHSKKVHTITSDEIKLAISNSTIESKNADVNELHQKIKEVQDKLGQDKEFIINPYPITIQILVNISGVTRLLYQSTIVLAATHQSQYSARKTTSKELDRQIRLCFEQKIQEMLSHFNSQKSTYNGFLTLFSNIQITYRNSIGVDSYREFDLSRQHKIKRDGKSVFSMHMVDTWVKRVNQIKNSNNSNVMIMYNGITSKKEVLINQFGQIPCQYIYDKTEIKNQKFGRLNFVSKELLNASTGLIIQSVVDIQNNVQSDFAQQITRNQLQLAQKYGIVLKKFKLIHIDQTTGKLMKEMQLSKNILHIIIFYDELPESQNTFSLLPFDLFGADKEEQLVISGRDSQRVFHQNCILQYGKEFKEVQVGNKKILQQVMNYGYVSPLQYQQKYDAVNKLNSKMLLQLYYELFTKNQLQNIQEGPVFYKNKTETNFNLQNLSCDVLQLKNLSILASQPLTNIPLNYEKCFLENYINAFESYDISFTQFMKFNIIGDLIDVLNDLLFDQQTVPDVAEMICQVVGLHAPTESEMEYLKQLITNQQIIRQTLDDIVTKIEYNQGIRRESSTVNIKSGPSLELSNDIPLETSFQKIEKEKKSNVWNKIMQIKQKMEEQKQQQKILFQPVEPLHKKPQTRTKPVQPQVQKTPELKTSELQQYTSVTECNILGITQESTINNQEIDTQRRNSFLDAQSVFINKDSKVKDRPQPPLPFNKSSAALQSYPSVFTKISPFTSPSFNFDAHTDTYINDDDFQQIALKQIEPQFTIKNEARWSFIESRNHQSPQISTLEPEMNKKEKPQRPDRMSMSEPALSLEMSTSSTNEGHSKIKPQKPLKKSSLFKKGEQM